MPRNVFGHEASTSAIFKCGRDSRRGSQPKAFVNYPARVYLIFLESLHQDWCEIAFFPKNRA